MWHYLPICIPEGGNIGWKGKRRKSLFEDKKRSELVHKRNSKLQRRRIHELEGEERTVCNLQTIKLSTEVEILM